MKKTWIAPALEVIAIENDQGEGPDGGTFS